MRRTEPDATAQLYTRRGDTSFLSIQNIIGTFAAEQIFGSSENCEELHKVLIDTWIVSDCDGILSDSRSIYNKDKKAFKTYGAYDKEAYLVAKALGMNFIFYTQDDAGYKITRKRMRDFLEANDFWMKFCFGGRYQRVKTIAELKGMYDRIGRPRTCKVYYFGDSISDVSIANDGEKTFGKSADGLYAPRNAPRFVKRFADYVAPHNGGDGAFADMVWHIIAEALRNLAIK